MQTISRENYLKNVFVLQQTHPQAVPMGALASALNVAPASVTGMVKSLVEAGLLKYEPYVGVSLTADGERAALDVIRRHRLIELFLVQTLDLDWSEVHEEAERLEHAISNKLLARIDDYLGQPTVDPHGDPIPTPSGRMKRSHLKTLASCEAGSRLRISRVVEQNPEFLRYVDRIGLKPGTEVIIEGNDALAQIVTVRPRDGVPIALSQRAAQTLLVEPA